MRVVYKTLLLLSLCCLVPGISGAAEYCWLNLKDSKSQLEFSCAYKQYGFVWEGASIAHDGKDVVQGAGFLTLINSKGQQTGKIPAEFNKGVLISDISLDLDFRKCLTGDCREVEYLMAEGSQVFRGKVTYSDSNRRSIKTLDYGVLFIGNNLYYHGAFENNAPSKKGYACIGNPDKSKSMESLYLENACPFPSAYLNGYWENGAFRSGFGRLLYSNGDYFEGNIKNGVIQGWGAYLWIEKSAYEGQFYNNQRDGVGVYRYPDGSVYSGGWKKNIKEGFGEMEVVGKTSFKYAGGFSKGVFHGEGILKFADGLLYVGNFANNMPDGEGLVYVDETHAYKSMFSKGSLLELEPLKAKASSWSFPSFASTAYAAEGEDAVRQTIVASLQKARQWISENKEHLVNSGIGCLAGGVGRSISRGVGAAFVGAIKGGPQGAGAYFLSSLGVGLIGGCWEQGLRAWRHSKVSGGEYTLNDGYQSFKTEFLSLDNLLWGVAAGGITATGIQDDIFKKISRFAGAELIEQNIAGELKILKYILNNAFQTAKQEKSEYLKFLGKATWDASKVAGVRTAEELIEGSTNQYINANPIEKK